jgi:hypothetical protein
MNQPSMQETFDRLAIDELHGRYLFALDWLDADTLSSLFTEDGVLDWAGGVIEGRAAIRRAVIGMEGYFATRGAAESPLRTPRLRHFVTNKIMDIKGDRATTMAFWLELDNDNRHRWPYVGAYGHYEDALIRTNEGWRFSRRTIFNEMMEERKGPAKNPGW